jgi:hypothetical protein
MELTPEKDYDQTAMGLLPVTSVVFLIAKLASNVGKTWASRRNIRDVSATPSGIQCEWYVLVCICIIHLCQLRIRACF